MENNKQTAVEWLIDQIKNDQNQKALSAKEWLGVIKQAKQMEKQQIIKAYMNVKDDRDYRMQDVILKEFSEQYCNETYGQSI